MATFMQDLGLTNLAIALHLTSCCFISTFQEFPKRFEQSKAIELEIPRMVS